MCVFCLCILDQNCLERKHVYGAEPLDSCRNQVVWCGMWCVMAWRGCCADAYVCDAGWRGTVDETGKMQDIAEINTDGPWLDHRVNLWKTQHNVKCCGRLPKPYLTLEEADIPGWLFICLAP